jgi:hypothetical protein
MPEQTEITPEEFVSDLEHALSKLVPEKLAEQVAFARLYAISVYNCEGIPVPMELENRIINLERKATWRGR